MNYRNVTATLLQVASRYKEDMEEAIRYLEEQDTFARMREKNPKVDARDFVPMVALMGIEGDTREERNADIQQKLDKMTVAFDDPDLSERDDYLDLIYYLLDDFAVNFDPITMNMSDPAEVERLLQSMLIEQTVNTKKLENPEYYNKRYPTPEARNLVDAHNGYRSAVGSTVMKNLCKEGIEIAGRLSLSKSFPDEAEEFQYLREAYAKKRLDTAIATKGDFSRSQTIELPISDSMIPCLGKSVADIPNASDDSLEQMGKYYTFMIENNLLQEDSKNTRGLKEAGISEVKEALYIDGQPFADFISEHFPQATKDDKLQRNIISTCILGGKHKVDVVTAFRNEAGEMQYEAKNLRVSVTPAQEALHLQQFSRVRRLFNRGSLRIESLQEKMDRIPEDPKTEERFARVIADQKARIETGLERVKEQELRNKRELARTEQRRTAYREAKTQLEASTAQWDKDSAIGVLGRQIAATYVIGGTEAVGACDAIRRTMETVIPAERYEKASPLFAKVVLYSRLCSERAANGGRPGEMEKLLGEGGSKIIEENIQNTTTLLVKNPVFKNLFLKKTGIEVKGVVYPDDTKFEELIGSGGCERFGLEYMQKLKTVVNQTEQQAPTNEAVMENRKQEVPKATM